jgi:hypothetical protein
MYEEASDLILPFVVTGIYTAVATLFAGLGFIFEFVASVGVLGE